MWCSAPPRRTRVARAEAPSLGDQLFDRLAGAVRRSRLGFAGCFTDPRTADGEFYELFVAPLIESNASFARQARLLQFLDFDLMRRFHEVHARIHVPVLLLWGSEDGFFPLAKARPMLKQFGGTAQLHEIATGKLFAHEDHAPEFAEHALVFLNAEFR
jgi:pimeloyl-ACP methyl ester carboxylesterase